MRTTKAGIKIIEESDPVEGETFEEAIGFALGEFRQNMNKIAEVIDDIQKQIDEMKGAFDTIRKTKAEKQAERKRKKQAYMKKYRSEHKEQMNLYNREWRKKNPEKRKAQKAREKERQKQKGGRT